VDNSVDNFGGVCIRFFLITKTSCLYNRNTLTFIKKERLTMVWVQTNFTAEAMNTGKPATETPVVAKPEPVAKKKAKPEPVAEVVAEVETPVVEEVVLAEPEVAEPEAE
jgi:hypothetical protein